VGRIRTAQALGVGFEEFIVCKAGLIWRKSVAKFGVTLIVLLRISPDDWRSYRQPKHEFSHACHQKERKAKQDDLRHKFFHFRITFEVSTCKTFSEIGTQTSSYHARYLVIADLPA